MDSTLHPGIVFHQRINPINYNFKYRTLSVLINLDELEVINKLPFFQLIHQISLAFILKIMERELKVVIQKILLKKNF